MFSMIASIDIDMDDPEAQEHMNMKKESIGLKAFTTADDKPPAYASATVLI
jgi:hypothetical protein